MSQQINLILPELQQRLDPLSLPVVCSLAAATVLAVAGLVAWESTATQRLKARLNAQTEEIEAVRQQLDGLAQALAKRPLRPELLTEIETARLAVAQRREALDALTRAGAGGPGHAGIFRGFAAQTMPGVWLTGFSLHGDQIEIRGRLSEPATLPSYIAGLNGNAAFAGRHFAALAMQGVAANPGTPAGHAGELAKPARPRYTEFALRSNLPAAEVAR